MGEHLLLAHHHGLDALGYVEHPHVAHLADRLRATSLMILLRGRPRCRPDAEADHGSLLATRFTISASASAGVR